jgi:hypothetical protein
VRDLRFTATEAPSSPAAPSSCPSLAQKLRCDRPTPAQVGQRHLPCSPPAAPTRAPGRPLTHLCKLVSGASCSPNSSRRPWYACTETQSGRKHAARTPAPKLSPPSGPSLPPPPPPPQPSPPRLPPPPPPTRRHSPPHLLPAAHVQLLQPGHARQHLERLQGAVAERLAARALQTQNPQTSHAGQRRQRSTVHLQTRGGRAPVRVAAAAGGRLLLSG